MSIRQEKPSIWPRVLSEMQIEFLLGSKVQCFPDVHTSQIDSAWNCFLNGISEPVTGHRIHWPNLWKLESSIL